MTAKPPIITFIMPGIGKKPGTPYPSSWLMEPLAIAQLSSRTPPDWRRTFHDDRLESIPYDQATDLVAITVETYTARRAYQIAAEYRKRHVPVVMGGFHPTLLPDEAAAYADAIVVGEAEDCWPRLLQDFHTGRLGRRYDSTARPNLEGIQPDRSLFAGKHYAPLALVETGRGCRFGCEFCSISSFFSQTYSTRPITDVVADIRLAGRKNVFFVDDNLAVDSNRATELFNALIPLRIRWMGQVSLNAARNPPLLDLMRRSGCLGILTGIESLNADNLAVMRKAVNANAGAVEQAVQTFRRHGLAVYATFVFGYDSDDEPAFERTLEFAIRNRFFFAAFNHLVPFPGTPLYARLKNEGRLLHDTWWLDESYRFGDVAFHPRLMTANRLAALCLEYRNRFYGLSSVIRRGLDPQVNCRTPFLTSLYFAQNLTSRRQIRLRQGLPLGLPGAAPEETAP